MDLSKLPKLSESDAPPPQPDPVQAVASQPTGSWAAESWISIVIGLILLLMGSRILSFIFSRSKFSETYSFTDENNNPLAYTKSIFFWGDLAMFLFALVLIVDGVVMGLAPRRAVYMFAFVLTAISTLLNLGYVIYMMNGYGLQLMSALAVAFGGYIAMYQFKRVQSFNLQPHAAV